LNNCSSYSLICFCSYNWFFLRWGSSFCDNWGFLGSNLNFFFWSGNWGTNSNWLCFWPLFFLFLTQIFHFFIEWHFILMLHVIFFLNQILMSSMMMMLSKRNLFLGLLRHNLNWGILILFTKWWKVVRRHLSPKLYGWNLSK